jgi:hypothetical protein
MEKEKIIGMGLSLKGVNIQVSIYNNLEKPCHAKSKERKNINVVYPFEYLSKIFK